MNYQEALNSLQEYVIEKLREDDLSINHFTIEFDLIQQLIDEKLEQESRKDKLIVGSEWECVAICYSEGISFRAPICLVNVKGIVEITEIGESDGIHYVEYSSQNERRLDEYAMPIDQFILCFKPIKEGNKDEG